MLPKDPYILMSVLNTKLRDFYPSLEALVKNEEADINEITASMASIGYRYDSVSNSFKKS